MNTTFKFADQFKVHVCSFRPWPARRLKALYITSGLVLVRSLVGTEKGKQACFYWS